MGDDAILGEGKSTFEEQILKEFNKAAEEALKPKKSAFQDLFESYRGKTAGVMVITYLEPGFSIAKEFMRTRIQQSKFTCVVSQSPFTPNVRVLSFFYPLNDDLLFPTLSEDAELKRNWDIERKSLEKFLSAARNSATPGYLLSPIDFFQMETTRIFLRRHGFSFEIIDHTTSRNGPYLVSFKPF